MNEAEWMGGADVVAMLDYIAATASDRKLRLFAVACCRRFWAEFKSHRRTAVEYAERLAEGEVDGSQRQEIEERAQGEAGDPPYFEQHIYQAAAATLNESALEAARLTRDLMRQRVVLEEAHGLPAGVVESRYTAAAAAAEGRAQARLLRELFGNPFRPVTIEPHWLRANAGAAGNLARLIREERRFDDLPILADALEDAGCANEALLSHLRERDGHARGCWALDALLGLG